METKKYGVIAVALVIAFVVIRWNIDELPDTARAKTEKAEITEVKQTNVTIQRLQDVLKRSKKLTELRRRVLGSYIGRQVQWQGRLESTDGSNGKFCAVLSHRIKPSWLFGRRRVKVTVNLPYSQRQRLLDVPEGSLTTYQGILSDYTGSPESPWLLTNGQILSVELADQPHVK